MLDALPNNQAGFQLKVFSVGRTNKIQVDCNMNIKRLLPDVTTIASVDLTTTGLITTDRTTEASTDTTTEQITTTTATTTMALTTQETIDKYHRFNHLCKILLLCQSD